MQHHSAVPLSHSFDPQTSYDAADRMLKSGKLNKQEQYVLDSIHSIAGSTMLSFNFTAKDIACWTTISYYTIQRRLSGLRNKGKIERTGERRNGCCVWKIKNGEENADPAM